MREQCLYFSIHIKDGSLRRSSLLTCFRRTSTCIRPDRLWTSLHCYPTLLLPFNRYVLLRKGFIQISRCLTSFTWYDALFSVNISTVDISTVTIGKSWISFGEHWMVRTYQNVISGIVRLFYWINFIFTWYLWLLKCLIPWLCDVQNIFQYVSFCQCEQSIFMTLNVCWWVSVCNDVSACININQSQTDEPSSITLS